MDLGDIILAVINAGIWAGIFFSGYQLFRMKKNIEEKGSKAVFRKILLCEVIMIVSGIILLWAVMYPPFAVYTWNKVYTGWAEKFLLAERVMYLLETVILLPAAIVVVGIMRIKKEKPKGDNMKKLHKITVLLVLASLFFGSVNVSQICAKPKAEAEDEDEEILLDDDELDSWEEEEEVWDDDEEYDEEDLYDDDEGDDDTIRLTTAIKKKWKNHYKAEVTVKNLTDASIDDWTIGFQCKDEIEKISKAKIIGYQNNYYYVQSLDGRQDIKANGKVTFEITVKYKGTMNEINSEFCADDCEINKDNYSAAYIEHPMWKDGVSGEIKIQNKSNKKIKDWRLLFTSNVKNWKMLNAGIVCQYLNDSNEMTYIVKGTKENKDMEANKNVSVYFTAQTDKTAVKVTPQKLYKKDVDAEEWQGQEESAELTEDDFMEYSDYLAYLELQKEEKKKEQMKEKWKEKEADALMKLKAGNTVMGVVVGAAFEKVFEVLGEK